jgi:uncharacterized protein YprB with RNaseH-like and TPR domain
MGGPDDRGRADVFDSLSVGGEALRRCGVERPGEGKSRAIPQCLAGWERAEDMVWIRDLRRMVEFPKAIDPLPFSSLSSLRRAAAARAAVSQGSPVPPPRAPIMESAGIPLLSEEPIPAESLRFFDLETTGLSGGSGTLAFLAALGRMDRGRLEIRQFFLEDFPGERTWLDILMKSIPPDSVLVSYNGRAFDMPLFRARCVMNGIRPFEMRHIDALPCSRRLWRRIYGGASLGLLEGELLGVDRREDLPAENIPEVWFSFLRNGDAPLMSAVMSHNADDIESLARLVASISVLFENPTTMASPPPVDLGSLGRTLLAMGRIDEGASILWTALENGDENAGLRLSKQYRRAGRQKERRRLLESLPMTFRSCVERAKFHEHTERDWVEALLWTRRAEELVDGEKLRDSLYRRRLRLERLIARSAGVSAHAPSVSASGESGHEDT